jgi:hypothetical protein
LVCIRHGLSGTRLPKRKQTAGDAMADCTITSPASSLPIPSTLPHHHSNPADDDDDTDDADYISCACVIHIILIAAFRGATLLLLILLLHSHTTHSLHMHLYVRPCARDRPSETAATYVKPFKLLFFPFHIVCPYRKQAVVQNHLNRPTSSVWGTALAQAQVFLV